MPDESVLIREDGPNRVRLYRRPDTPNFYFEVFIERKRVKRGSTGSDHAQSARRIALDEYETLLSKHRRGVPLRSSSLKVLITEHLAERDLEVERGEISAATVDQARIVLMQYFLPWCENAGIDNLMDMSDQRMREYVGWRRSYRPDEDTITYMRNGKRVTAKRPANHLRGLSGVSLVKQLDPIRRFFQWSVDLGHIEDRSRPRMPRIRTKEGRRPSPSGDDVPGRWFFPEQAVALIQTAVAEARLAHGRAIHALKAYGPKYRERFVDEYGHFQVSRKAADAELFFYWIILMLVGGTRPIELKNLRWKHLGYYRYSTGRLGVTLTVTGKKKRRQILLDRDFLEVFYRIAGLISNEIPQEIDLCDDLPEDPQLLPYGRLQTPAIQFHGRINDSLQREQFVFPVRDFSSRFYGLMKRAGVYAPGHSPYSLRHTHINFRLLQGDLPQQISIRVGNSVKMIEQYYNALTPILFGEREHNARFGETLQKDTREFEEIIVKQAMTAMQQPIRTVTTMSQDAAMSNNEGCTD